MPRRAPRRLLELALWGDPRPAMIAYAFHAAVFGAVVAAEDLAARLSEVGATPIERAVYGGFEALPGVAVGSAFVGAAVLLVLGVLLERRRPVRWAALLLFGLWAYTFATLPVWMAVGGQLVPTAWARYGTPLVVAWWVYLRAPGPEAAHWRLVPRGRRPTWLPLLAVAFPVPAVALVAMAQVEFPDAGGAGLLAAAVSVATLLAKWAADKLRARTDFTTAVTEAAVRHSEFLTGHSNETIERLSRELAALQAQFSQHLALRDRQDKFCRNRCPTYADRPTA